ncbi:MAG: hypothetical protein ACREMH_05935 [Gemmatimonadales bacterium]
MTFDAYRYLHFLGLFLLFLGLGAVFFHAATGGEKRIPARPLAMVTHGLGSVLVLVGGFGMLARLGVAAGGLPGWLHPKLAVWLLLSVAVALPYRRPSLARPAFVLLPVLGAIAAWFGIFHA